MAASAEAHHALDLSQVKAADIILTASGSAGSQGIRHTTCSPFSHAILVLEDGKAIEAIPDSGVGRSLLSDALEKSTYAVQYRHKGINEDYALWVCHFAKAQEGKEYDYYGAVRSGASTGCSLTLYTAPGFLVRLTHDVTQKRKHNNQFFCSELIASSFEKAGLPLLNIPSHAVTPGAIAASDKLTLINDLITA